jgi:rare lipoprotein A
MIARSFQWITTALLGFVLVGCHSLQEATTPPSRSNQPAVFRTETVKTEKGIASYYAGRWIGRKTANGEIYRAGDRTAAHKTLPFNTMVRVTNLRNGKSTVVRINNRGPFIKGRIIDLSLVAAREIDMIKAGIVPVKVEVLREIPVLTRPNIRRQPAASP